MQLTSSMAAAVFGVLMAACTINPTGTSSSGSSGSSGSTSSSGNGSSGENTSSSSSSGATTPAGNVPSEMVGTWASREIEWQFFADGTAKRTTLGKTGGCKTARLESGVAVANGNELTVHFTSTKYTVCDSPGNTGSWQPKSEAFTWKSGTTTDGAPTLFIQEKTCQYDDPDQAAFYCGTAFDKID